MPSLCSRQRDLLHCCIVVSCRLGAASVSASTSVVTKRQLQTVPPAGLSSAREMVRSVGRRVSTHGRTRRREALASQSDVRTICRQDRTLGRCHAMKFCAQWLKKASLLNLYVSEQADQSGNRVRLVRTSYFSGAQWFHQLNKVSHPYPTSCSQRTNIEHEHKLYIAQKTLIHVAIKRSNAPCYVRCRYGPPHCYLFRLAGPYRPAGAG